MSRVLAAYLPHIDGLRAIALMGVLLFHFEVYPFNGGFAGVDIFLTISGYLITRNVITHHSKSTPFSLKNFYIRRFFRLYPAATVTVLLAVTCSAAIFPNDLEKEAAESGLASMLVSANTYFHLKSGYFDTSSSVKPLLHMWSLSLEEQFYLLWAPLLLLHFSFFPTHLVMQRMKLTLAILTILSIVGAAYFAKFAPSFSFFHLPSRIFQFSLGAGLAAWQRGDMTDNDSSIIHEASLAENPKRLSTRWCIESSIAASILFLSFVFVPEGSPSLAILPLNLSTVLLLANPDAPVCKHILASKHFVWLGRLSYSAYLVHWPLYVCLRYIQMAWSSSKPNPLIMTALTILLAIFLKNIVEDPVRKGASSSRTVFGITLFITLLACYQTSRLEVSVNSQLKGVAEREATKFLFGSEDVERSSLHEIESPIVTHRKLVLSRVSHTGDIKSSSEPALTFFGNSFAAHLVPALNMIGQRRKVWFRLYIAPSCGVFAPSQWHKIEPSYFDCRKFNEFMWDAVDKLPPNSTVVLAQLWGLTLLKPFVDRVKPIAEEFAKRKLKSVFLGEPPGLAKEYESYYSCIDMLEKPIARILPPKRNGNLCGFDIRHGGRPSKTRMESETVYREAFPKHIPEMKYVSVMKAICTMTHDDTHKIVDANCRVPTSAFMNRFPNIVDPGYKRDLNHLNVLGSAGLSNTYEKLFSDFVE